MKHVRNASREEIDASNTISCSGNCSICRFYNKSNNKCNAAIAVSHNDMSDKFKAHDRWALGVIHDTCESVRHNCYKCPIFKQLKCIKPLIRYNKPIKHDTLGYALATAVAALMFIGGAIWTYMR